MPWTQFYDMSSGGSQKLQWHKIYIEAPEAEAKSVFYARLGRNPDHVTCNCCGSDYSITESATLEQATAYDRNCDYDDAAREWVERQGGRFTSGEYMTLDAWRARFSDCASPECLLVFSSEIKPEERAAEVPKEGRAWD